MSTPRLKFMPINNARKAVSREAMLEPIKPQRNVEKKATNSRKIEKSEPRGRVRKVKENVTPSYLNFHYLKTLDDGKSFQPEKCKREAINSRCAKKLVDEEAIQVEKSDITEEHEPPTFVENNSYLSDVTQNSQKRKRPLILRIKLRKPSEPDVSTAPSTSGRAEVGAETKLKLGPVASTPDLELPCRALEASERIETAGDKIIACSSSEDHIQSGHSLYSTPIENWIPPPIQHFFTDIGDEDVDWLSGTNQQSSSGSKRSKPSNEASSCFTSSSQWPRAQLLPEAGVYALPFTLPF